MIYLFSIIIYNLFYMIYLFFNNLHSFLSRSSIPVNDGSWHSVVTQFTPSLLRIAVDQHESTFPIASSGKKYLDLSGPLFIGGLEINKKARALQQGIRSADKRYAIIHSLIICIFGVT